MGAVTGNGQAQSGLGGVSGFGEVALARSDAASFAIDVSQVFENGFVLGGVAYSSTALFVSTDGFLTFGSAPAAGYLASPSIMSGPIIAAFMADIDTRLDGEGTESGPIWVDVDPQSDVVTITWENVGFYRRNADLTNTFQIQLFDRGTAGMDVVFRYDMISWTAGDLQGGWDGLGGVAATIGVRTAATGPITLFGASGNEAAQLALPTTLGNTNEYGMWVIHVPASGAAGGIPEDLISPGSAENDIISGTEAADTLEGNSGDDVLDGGGGADLLNGGADFDIASYASAPSGATVSLMRPSSNTGDAAGDLFIGIEGLQGSNFADLLEGNAAHNLLIGGGGNDTLIGGLGFDTLVGGAGFDWADYSAATSGMTVSLANAGQNAGYALGDNLREIEGILGGRYNDLLIGTALGQHLDGGGGDDTLRGGGGADTMFGGAGFDWASYETSSAVWVDLLYMSQSKGDAAGDILIDIEGLLGSGGADSLLGDTRDNFIYGRDGHDFIDGRAGNDWLEGEAGNDTLRGGVGADTLRGGSGFDFASYSAAQSGIFLDMAAPHTAKGEAQGDHLAEIEGLIGSYHNDTLLGDANNNLLYGGTGTDWLYGQNGNDTLIGDSGSDVLWGGQGNDVLWGAQGLDRIYGGEGNDRLHGGTEGDTLYGDNGTDSLYGDVGRDHLYGGNCNDYLRGGTDHDVLFGDAGNDQLFGDAGNDVLTGGLGNDTQYGGDGNDTFYGNTGHDLLLGENGNDHLAGGDGNDRLYAGAGDDRLIGGVGRDFLYGGAGRDTFQFSFINDSANSAGHSDIIYDFQRGYDRIDLSGMDASTRIAGNNSFLFVGTKPISASPHGEVSFRQFNNPGTSNDYTLIYIDNDADKASEAIIRLSGLHSLTARDFIL